MAITDFTQAQLTTLKNDMLTNQAANVTAGNHGGIAAYYNANGAGLIWRPDIGVSELNTAVVWSDFAALTAIKQNTYFAMIAPGIVDATSVNIRNGFTAVFGAGTPSVTNLTALAQRAPTRLEALYVTSGVTAKYNVKLLAGDISYVLGNG